jgi:hypothetical protein
VQLEVLQLDIIYPDIVKGVFHMVLNIVQGYQDELGDHHYKVHHNIAVDSPNIVNDGGRVDKRENIDENKAVSLQGHGSPVDVDGKYVLETFLHVIHVPEDPVLDPSWDKLLQFHDMGVEFFNGLIHRFHIFLIILKVFYGFITDPRQDFFRSLFVLIGHVRACFQVKFDRNQGRAVLAEVLERFFTPSESAPNIEYQWENNGDTEEGQIQVIPQIEMNGDIGHYDRYDEGDIRLPVNY